MKTRIFTLIVSLFIATMTCSSKFFMNVTIGNISYDLNDDKTATLVECLGEGQNTKLTVPSTVTYIGSAAFAGCKNLAVIYCEAESQPDEWSYDWNYYDHMVVWGFTDFGTSVETAYVINIDQSIEVVIDVPGETVYFVFTATESREYSFESTGEYDTYGSLYDYSGQYEIRYDDDSGEDRNFCMTYWLEEGEKIYIVARMYYSGVTGYFYVSVN